MLGLVFATPRDRTVSIFSASTVSRLYAQILIFLSSKRSEKEYLISVGVIEKYKDVIKQIEESEQLNSFWSKYTKEFDYAKDIVFADICKLLSDIMNKLTF